jgi:hypothetical protein
MGKPVINGVERFEKFSIDGVTVWRSNSVSPAKPDQPITIDLGGLLFLGKRVVLKNAR